MYGDDRAIRYTGADGVSGDAENAQATEWGLAGIKLGFCLCYNLCFDLI